MTTTPEEETVHLYADRLGVDPAAVRHSLRFRQVANRYPQQVTYAYGGDIARAMAASDEQVAATVAAWERAQGLTPRDWLAHGAAERDDGDQ